MYRREPLDAPRKPVSLAFSAATDDVLRAVLPQMFRAVDEDRKLAKADTESYARKLSGLVETERRKRR